MWLILLKYIECRVSSIVILQSQVSSYCIDSSIKYSSIAILLFEYLAHSVSQLCALAINTTIRIKKLNYLPIEINNNKRRNDPFTIRYSDDIFYEGLIEYYSDIH